MLYRWSMKDGKVYSFLRMTSSYFRDWMEMMLGEIKDNEIEWDLM